MLNFDQIDPDFNVTCWFLRSLNHFEVNLIQLGEIYIHHSGDFDKFDPLGIFSGKIPRNSYQVTKQFFPGYQVYLSQVTSFIAPPRVLRRHSPRVRKPVAFPKTFEAKIVAHQVPGDGGCFHL